jgi:hypothetical protein
MKAHILDPEALCAISPAALSAFARSESWSKVEGYGAHADVYAATDRPEIIVPRTDLLADYASAVSRLIEVFATSSGRDELAVYRDLVGADRDVVRVRVLGTENDGSVVLDDGVRIVAQARDMLLAAACAVRSPQPVYRPDANREATDYLRRVKLGQTEQGSFVVTLLAPVPPLLESARAPVPVPFPVPFPGPVPGLASSLAWARPKNGPAVNLASTPGAASTSTSTSTSSWASLADEPLERLVTRRLMEALAAMRAAAEQTLSGDGAAFDNAVAAGVSANLCEAVAGLIDQSAGVEISLTWARTRPTPEARRKVTFSAKDAEIFKEAARTFRQRQPRTGVSLFGTVRRLNAGVAEVQGVVTLRAMVDDQLQPVNTVLDQANYSVAARAHAARTPVIVTGDLERVGQRWQMTNATVRELPADDGDAD